jgi:hypothetical protein
VTIRDNRALVAALLAVDGVAGASIEATRAGPGTLRLQLAAGTDQVIVAGEVNRLLRSKFGLAVDPDRVRPVKEPFPPMTVAPARAAGAYARDADDVTRISVPVPAVVNDVDPPAAPVVSLARPSRVTIESVQLVSAGLGATVSVTLGLDARLFEGEAEAAATQTGLLRSVGTATLRAVEKITDGAVRFEVEHVEVTRIGTDPTALVVITMLTGRSTLRLSGASVVREDPRQAVIRAVLAAINRRMEPLLAEQ